MLKYMENNPIVCITEVGQNMLSMEYRIYIIFSLFTRMHEIILLQDELRLFDCIKNENP